MIRYDQHVSTATTPQSEPIPGTAQVANSAGGYAWSVDDWTRLDRFLVLGAEGGTYYIGERTLTRENAKAVERCIAQDGARVVRQVVAVSDAGRAPKNDPALFVLAMAASLGDAVTRTAALDALPKVARIGTHLFHFCQYAQAFRGWGRGLRRAVARWYADRSPDALAHQLVKYRQRDGWTHRDALRLSHAKPPTPQHDALFRWAVGKEGPVPHEFVQAFVECQQAQTAEQAAYWIAAHELPREAVPTHFLSDPLVWEALLESMPMTALIRNLGVMTATGVIAPMTPNTTNVVAQLGDGDRLRKARVHPITVLAALKVYQMGHGVRGSTTWAPVPAVIDALDAAFYASFGNVTPTGKRIMLALDVSGSMDGNKINGLDFLDAREGSSAMALVTAAVEPLHAVVAFTAGGFQTRQGGSGIVPLDISRRRRLDDVVRTTRGLPFGGTDCALPMLYAAHRNDQVDAFVVYTDSETWAGSVHPVQALRQYREKTGIAAKLIVVGMCSNEFTIADPTDSGMLDVVGFDTAAPQVLADFMASTPATPEAGAR